MPYIDLIQSLSGPALVFVTLILVIVTAVNVWKTSQMAEATKIMAAATKLSADEQKIQRDIERDKKIIIYTVAQQPPGFMLIEDLPLKTKLDKQRIDYLIPEITGPMDQLRTYQPEKGGLIIRLRSGGEFQTAKR